ncbi:MAG: hypothetical protein GY826_17225 [Fuerstiella sp.]|nr:hypothetical protein [Fuerstiella sp.]
MNSIPSTLPSGHIQTGTATPVQRSEGSVSEEFESLFLGRFVDEMMKTVPDTVFGGEQQAEMWRSFLSDAVAEQLVEADSLSLSPNISRAVAAYGDAQNRGDS